jgi:hypothetical protein
MDYTPVTLSDAQYPHQTTNAHELALPVVFESGIVHFADDHEAYGGLPDAARQFLQDVPVAWDESRLLEGDPGRLALIARRRGGEWWVGAISGTGEIQTVGVDLTFLGEGLYEGLIIRDGGASRHVLTEAAELRANDRLNIQLLPRGGFALRFTPKQRARSNE